MTESLGWSVATNVGAMLLAVLSAGLAASGAAELESFDLQSEEVMLKDVSDETETRFRSMRFNRALNVWNVEVRIVNTGTADLTGPFVVRFDDLINTTGPLQPDGLNHGLPFLDLSASVPGVVLSPGEMSQPLTLSLGRSTGSPSVRSKVFARGPPAKGLALAASRSLDGSGLPLPSVEVIEAGPAGVMTHRTDPGFGVLTLGQGDGRHVWKFSAPGYLPVWRIRNLRSNEVVLLPNPRLPARAPVSMPVTPLAGGTVSNETGSIVFQFPPGSMARRTDATLTAISGQSLPALLPWGWSPLQAFWLELGAEPTMAVSGSLRPWGAIQSGETATLARWNPDLLQWEAWQTVAGNGANAVTVQISGSGAFVLVVADRGPGSPAIPEIGQPLPAGMLAAPDFSGLAAGGRVTPSSRPASLMAAEVTAKATVNITNASGAMPSGLVLHCDLSETYQLTDGSQRFPPGYESFIVGYQRPGDDDPATLVASFSLRPQLLFDSGELGEAVVRVEVLAPGDFVGSVVETNGGLASLPGLRILAGVGDVNRAQAVRLRALDPTNFLSAAGGSLELVHAFELAIGPLADGHRLTPQFGGLSPDAHFILARVLTGGGQIGLQPLERLVTDSAGNTSSVEPATGERLPGLDRSGQFVLARISGLQGLVAGVARNGQGQPEAGLVVRVAGRPWLTLSAEDGGYRLIAPRGNAVLNIFDTETGDTGATDFEVTDPVLVVMADIAAAAGGPLVAEVSPANGATGVARVSSVVVTFSEAVNPGTLLDGGLQLLATNGQPVQGSLSLNLANTRATFLPAAQLEPGAFYTINISGNVADRAGLPLEGARQFTFTTVAASARDQAAQLVIYEPGATNIPPAILDDIPAFTPGQERDAVVVHGTLGAADPGVPVVLVNESSGETVTVLSKADGSFNSVITGAEEDFVSATFVSLNGARIYVPVSRQEFDNGFVGLYPQGGILEAQSDGGPVRVLVEPGAIETKTKIQIEPIELGKLSAALGTLPADGAVLLGGFSMAVEGDDLSVGADVSFPVNPADLGLPAGVAPEDASFALTVPQQLDDGTIAYEIIDQMHYEDGALVTHSPPFSGVLLRRIVRNMESTRKLRLSNQILSALGLPGIQETIVHQLMLPIMMAAGSSVRISGSVRAAEFDSDGNIVPGTERIVPGALVTYHHEGIQWRPGRIRAGTTFSTADQNGKYAFLMPADLITGPVGVNLVASHPQFFPQVAAGGATIANLDAAAQNPVLFVTLYFELIEGDVPLGDDQVPPRIDFSQAPRDPPPGTNDSDGATVTVSARDDREVTSLTLVIEDYKPLNPALTNLPPAPEIEDEVETTFGTVLRQKTFHLRSSIRASLVVKALANDSAGNLRETRFPVVFAGDRIFPDPTDTAPGPRLLSSWPPDGASAVQPGEPLVLRFSAPLRVGMEAAVGDWLTPVGARVVSVEMSADRKTATVAFLAAPGASLSFTILPELLGANEKAFDQDPATDGDQSQTLLMQMVPSLETALAGIESGGGVAVQGAYAYVLERFGPLDGAVVVYELSSGAPVRVAEASVPGYPRDLALIPHYSYRLSEAVSCTTGNLLAVVGGVAGAETFQYLWVFDVSNPSSPQRLAAAPVTFAISALNKVQWSPPFLAYLESGADVTSVALVNLQTFVIGLNAGEDEINAFPADGRVGVDANRDGDFCDDGDVLPLPIRNAPEFFGKDFTITVNTTQRIQDFDFDADEGLVGLTLGGGFRRGPNGLPDTGNVALPSYTTAFSGLGRPDPDRATVAFQAGDIPKRVAIMTSVLLRDTAGGETRRNLAVVSLNKASGGHALFVIDISDVETPVILAELDVSRIRHSADPGAPGGRPVGPGDVDGRVAVGSDAVSSAAASRWRDGGPGGETAGPGQRCAFLCGARQRHQCDQRGRTQSDAQQRPQAVHCQLPQFPTDDREPDRRGFGRSADGPFGRRRRAIDINRGAPFLRRDQQHIPRPADPDRGGALLRPG